MMTATKPTSKVLVEFMPGRVVELPLAALTKPPRYIISKLVPRPNGTMAAVPVEWSPMVRMSRELHKDLGLPCSYRTLYKLVTAGMVAGCLPSPWVLMIDLGSLIDHFNATRIDPELPKFWTRERIEAFRQAEGALTEIGE